MTWAIFGSKAWAFLKQVPIWVWIFIVFLITLKWVEASNFQKGKDAANDETRQKQADVRVRVNERSNEIITEERKHAEAALEARDSGPLYPSAGVVPDAIARVGFRREGGS